MTRNNRVFPSHNRRDDLIRSAAQPRQDLLEVTGELSLRSPASRRRRMLAAVAAFILITGLVAHFTIDSAAGDFVADALYAVMLFVVLSFVFVRTAAWRIGVASFVACAGIELFQLTGVPAALAGAFPPSRLLLGTTFTAIDLVAYFVGALGAALVVTWTRPD
ncbi:DUF2809 domain-containing protein [Cryobacterium sp.]|jgi:hypothetical protein|uniref:ribosomal maturation YjgA family protein n=1 Tax=Cryobacterium sp. TaxID=1926290 RepID=UPI00261B6AF2|nr:DUF2809 domain-containing protein [Cryobacterium sp.]